MPWLDMNIQAAHAPSCSSSSRQVPHCSKARLHPHVPYTGMQSQVAPPHGQVNSVAIPFSTTVLMNTHNVRPGRQNLPTYCLKQHTYANTGQINTTKQHSQINTPMHNLYRFGETSAHQQNLSTRTRHRVACTCPLARQVKGPPIMLPTMGHELEPIRS
jgi:hypothetical protein